MLIKKEESSVNLFYYILVLVDIENKVDINFDENFCDVVLSLLNDKFFSNFDVKIGYI